MTQIPSNGETSPLPAEAGPVGASPAGMTPNGYSPDSPAPQGGEVAPQYPPTYPQPASYPVSPQPGAYPQSPWQGQVPWQGQAPWPGQAPWQGQPPNPMAAPAGNLPAQSPYYQPLPAPLPNGALPNSGLPNGATPPPQPRKKHRGWWITLIVLMVLALVAAGLFFGLRWLKTDDGAAGKGKTASAAAGESTKPAPATSVPADYIKKIDFANGYLPNFSEYSAEKCSENKGEDTEVPFVKMPDTSDPCWIKMEDGVSEDKFPESFDQGYRHIDAGDPVSKLGKNSPNAIGWEEYDHPSGTPYYLADMNGDGYLDAMTVGGNTPEGTFANLCILDPTDPDHPYCLTLWITLGGSQRFDFRGNNEMARALNNGDIESTFTVSMKDGKPYLTERAQD